MDLFSVSTFLFASKWVFVGLIYFALIVVLIAVRREMGLRLGAGLPLPSAAPGRLVVLKSGGDMRLSAGSIIPLQVENRVGSEPDNNVILEDSFVSGHQARLRWDGVAWWLEDLGSKNGSFVNGKPAAAYQPQSVPPGSILRFGEVEFELAE